MKYHMCPKQKETLISQVLKTKEIESLLSLLVFVTFNPAFNRNSEISRIASPVLS